MSVLIKGGRIVTAADDYVGDVYVENGAVTLLGASLDVAADKVIDAAGKIVMPGAIDPHTHIEMFFGGTTTCDDFTSGTTSAAFGGTTTLIDFCMQTPGETFAAGAREVPREDRALQAGDRRRLPHRGHRPPRRAARSRTSRSCPDEGVTSYKLFMAYKGAVMVDDETLFRAMQIAPRDRRARHGARGERRRDRPHRQEGRRGGEDGADLARAHAADGDRGRGDEPRDPARAHRRLPALRRPRLLPAGGRADRARAREGLGASGARRAPSTSSSTRSTLEKPELRGREVHLHAAAAAEGAPGAPLEGARDGRALGASRPTTARSTGRSRRAINGREFQVVPNGGPGIENRLHMLARTSACATGRITPNRFVELVSTNIAKLFGLYPRKGTIAPGLRRRHRRLGSGEEAHDLGRDAPLERQLQPLRGRARSPARPRSCSSAAR